MTILACGLSIYSYAINEKIDTVNRMLDREKLRNEVLLGEKLMIGKALVKANVRLASFENIYGGNVRPSGTAETSATGELILKDDNGKEDKKRN